MPAIDASGSSNRELLKLRIVTHLSDMQELKEEIAADGGRMIGSEPFVPKSSEQEQYLASAFEPLTVALCVVSLTWAAAHLMRTIKLAGHSGLIIERTGSAVESRENPALAPGTVLVITPEGSQLYDTATQAIDMLSLLAKVVAAIHPS